MATTQVPTESSATPQRNSPILVKTESGWAVLKYGSNDTILDLKRQLEASHHCPVDSQQFFLTDGSHSDPIEHVEDSRRVKHIVARFGVLNVRVVEVAQPNQPPLRRGSNTIGSAVPSLTSNQPPSSAKSFSGGDGVPTRISPASRDQGPNSQFSLHTPLHEPVPEKSDYAIDELDESHDTDDFTAKGAAGRRMSEQNSPEPEDISQVRRHSFADVPIPTRQASIGSIGEAALAHQPTSRDTRQSQDFGGPPYPNARNFPANHTQSYFTSPSTPYTPRKATTGVKYTHASGSNLVGSQQSLVASAPPTRKRLARGPEILLPRHINYPPAPHETRCKLLELLYDELVRLNSELKEDADGDKDNLVLSNQELIWMALDEEEALAKENPAIYSNAIKHRILAYKRLTVAQWKQQRIDASAFNNLHRSAHGLAAPLPNRPPFPHRGMPGMTQPNRSTPLHVVLFKCARADVFYIQEGSALTVKPGDLVIVEADRGTDLGTVAVEGVDWPEAKRLKEHYDEEQCKWLMMYSQNADVRQDGVGAGLMAASSGLQGSAVGGIGPPGQHHLQESNVGELKPKLLIRLAQSHEVDALRDKEANEAKAKRICIQKVKEHGLNMEILDAEFQMDWKKLTFYYFVNSYISFNSLVVDLFKIYKIRIWMSAINPASFAGHQEIVHSIDRDFEDQPDYMNIEDRIVDPSEGDSESIARDHTISDSSHDSKPGFPSTSATSLSRSQGQKNAVLLQAHSPTMPPTPFGAVAENPQIGCSRDDDDFDRKSQRSIASYQSSESSMDSYTAIFENWLRQIIEERLQWKSPEDQTLLSEILPETLREFSTRLSQKGKSGDHRKVMWFVNVMCGSRNSSDSVVMRTLKDLRPERTFVEDSHMEDDAAEGIRDVKYEVGAVNRDKSESMSVDEKMEMLMQHQQRVTVSDIRERYRDILEDPEEEAWFLSSLKQHRGLRGIDPLDKKAIRQSVITALRGRPNAKGAGADQRHADSARISPNRDAPTSTAHFEVQWNPAAFVEEVQVPCSEDDVVWPRVHDSPDGTNEMPKLPLLARLVTVTGDGNRLQALPCREYMIQTWPLPVSSTPPGSLAMPPLLSLICRLLENPKSQLGHLEPIGWGSSIRASLHYEQGILRVSVNGTDYEIAEIAEQLAWLGSALRAPEKDGIFSVCRPELALVLDQLGDRRSFSMRFKVLEKPIGSDDGLNLCWMGFFKRLTVAQGYPIPSRPDGFDGLQIPLHQAAKIIHARKIDRFRSRHMVKGYSTALYPTRVSHADNFIAWHFIENGDGSHLSYADPRIGKGEDENSVKPLRHDDMEKACHIIGWCPHVQNVTGTRHGVYSGIHVSGLGRVTDYEAALEKVEISGGATNFKLAGTVAFCKRLRGESLQFNQSQSDWVKSIEAVGKGGKCVILYDAPEKRAWLVDGYSALMHLFRASLQNDNEGRSQFLYEETKPGHPTTEGSPSAKRFELAKLDHLEEELEQKEGKSRLNSVPLAILTSRKFCSMELRRQGYGPTSEGTEADTNFYVADRISDLVEGLEKIQATVAVSNTEPKPIVRISTSSATILEGYDFWEVASLGGPGMLPAKSVKLHQVAKGWLKFMRTIGAVTLFGSGFGNILRPVEMANGGCKRCLWNKPMPLEKDILALTVADLEYLHREEWRTANTNDRMVRMKFPWKDPASCFKPCAARCGPKANCSGPVRMQAFIPPPGLGNNASSIAKDLARRLRYPFTPQSRSVSRETKKFWRSGAILLGVPDGDLLRGKVAFAAPEDETSTHMSNLESTAYLEWAEAEGQRTPSVTFSGSDGDTRASATSPSENPGSSMTTHTSRTDPSTTTEGTGTLNRLTAATPAPEGKQKEREHGAYPDIDKIYQVQETPADASGQSEEASSTRPPRTTAASSAAPILSSVQPPIVLPSPNSGNAAAAPVAPENALNETAMTGASSTPTASSR